jgi:mannose-6-phosphate isomerase-like protein (cupin superfamily)
MKKPHLDNLELCVIHTRAGERIDPQLARLLDPVDPATFHEYVLGANADVELHGHDYDEYWWFTSGTPVVTLYNEAVGTRHFQLQPGDMVACLRGVAHTLRADHELVYYQFSSIRGEGAREGHLLPEELSR